MTQAELEVRWEQAEKLAGRPAPDLRMTEAQFEKWLDEDIRAEWVNGKVIIMAPASSEHISLNGWLWHVVDGFVEHDDLGQVLAIESQIRLPKVRRNPDLLFVAKSRSRIVKATYVDGPPDLIMEIVSPDSESRDWREKYSNYESGGVREYWIIDPSSKHVEAYSLGRDKRYKQIEENDDQIFSKVLRGFYLRPQWLWKSPLPKVAVVLKELGAR